MKDFTLVLTAPPWVEAFEAYWPRIEASLRVDEPSVTRVIVDEFCNDYASRVMTPLKKGNDRSRAAFHSMIAEKALHEMARLIVVHLKQLPPAH